MTEDARIEPLREMREQAKLGGGEERIARSQAGPADRKRSQLPLIIVKVDTIFAPVLAIRHQFKLAPTKRMKRMRHPKSSTPFVAIRCN